MYSAISVIIPTYYRDDLLKRSIESSLSAIDEFDEIIIIDGGEDGTTEEVVKSYSDSRLNYYYQENNGISAARNYGMEVAKNSLIAFIDDDDEWHPDKLDIQRQLLAQHPEAVACFSNFWVTDNAGNITTNYIFQWGQPVQNWNQLLGCKKDFLLEKTGQTFDYYFGEHYFNQMLDDYMLPSSLLIDRSKFRDKLTFRVGMQRNESWFFTSKVARQGPVIYVDYDLTCQHGDAPVRLTDISTVDTVMSRLYVLENEFGKQTDFLINNQMKYNIRMKREVNALFLAIMYTNKTDRKNLLQKNTHRGARFALTAKLPNLLISTIHFLIRVLNFVKKKITKF